MPFLCKKIRFSTVATCIFLVESLPFQDFRVRVAKSTRSLKGANFSGQEIERGGKKVEVDLWEEIYLKRPANMNITNDIYIFIYTFIHWHVYIDTISVLIPISMCYTYIYTYIYMYTYIYVCKCKHIIFCWGVLNCLWPWLSNQFWWSNIRIDWDDEMLKMEELFWKSRLRRCSIEVDK